MELVQRYIAAVQRELPENKRDEIGRELKANILDQLDALANDAEPSPEQINQVLKQMGRPSVVARQFVPARPLIEAEQMQTYLYTLYIVLGVLFVLQVLGSTVVWLDHDIGLLLFIKSVISGMLDDACFAFTAITLAFALSPKSGKPANSTNWHPAQLPPVDAPWQHISLQDIFTDLATYAFVLVVVWYPVTLTVEELAAQGLMLSAPAAAILKWCTPLMAAGIAMSLWQLRERYWNRTMQWLNVALNSAFVVVLLYLATLGPLLHFNADNWVQVFGEERLVRAMTWGLVITAGFPAYEVLRDLRRLWLSRN